MNIGIALYGNPDHYPPTLNLIWLLQKKYNIFVFSRNMEFMENSFAGNVTCYRYWKNTSAIEREKMSIVLKIVEYLCFFLQTVIGLQRHKCKVIIVYDPYALLPALLLKMLNVSVYIFYHAHEIDVLENRKWTSLAYWIQNIAYKNLHMCSWISQPDIKRVELFQKKFGLNIVRLQRNFALSQYPYLKDKNVLCSNYKENGYMIFGYLGMISKDFYFDKLIEYTEKTKMKTLIVLAGNVRDFSLLKDLEKLNSKNTLAKMIYLGYLTRDEKYALLNSIDIGLILYRFNHGMIEMNAGASNKVGEYLAFGKPIIYPEWWNYESFYKEVGLGYKDGNELISKIELLAVNSELRNELGGGARRLFNQYINFENESKAMRELIDKCTDGNYGR